MCWEMGIEYVLTDPLFKQSKAGGDCCLELLSMAVNVPLIPSLVTNALNL